MVRWAWGQLTSMRTALVLLFLLAAAAIPGSLVPQSASSPIKVADFARAHPTLDRIYRPLGMYHVYTSVWFSAIYLLLFVSLIGCIIPRILTHARALRRQPPRVPARLERLPGHASAVVPAAEGERVGARAASWLRSHHYRVVADPDGALRAERGRHRETGNLVFHVLLVVVLLGVAWNSLWGFKGTAVVVEGQGFSNTLTQYDDFHAGAMVDSTDLPPFSLVLDSFRVRFETGDVQRGAAREFNASVRLTADGHTSRRTIEVNHPLDVDGARVHLLGHGYAPVVTVRDGNGQVALSGPVVFLPQDGNFRSAGVVSVPDARPKRLAFQGFFLPTGTVGAQGPQSLFPDALNPQLYLNAWSGPPATETGRPTNVFVLDTTGLTQVSQEGKKVSFVLAPGQGYTLPDGLGSIEFNGWKRWAKIQVSRAPGLPLTFAALLVAVAGLSMSLFIRPRRLWLRTVEEDGALRVEVGGIDRADARTGLDEDVADLLAAAVGRSGSVPGGAPGDTVAPTAPKEDHS